MFSIKADLCVRMSAHYVRPLGPDGEAQWTHCCAGEGGGLCCKVGRIEENGSSDVLSRKKDIQQNWKSFSELREETDLRLQAAYSQLQVRCTPCNAPVDKLLLSLRCIQCSANSLWDEVTGSWIWAISHCLSLDCVLFLSIVSTVKTAHEVSSLLVGCSMTWQRIYIAFSQDLFMASAWQLIHSHTYV